MVLSVARKKTAPDLDQECDEQEDLSYTRQDECSLEQPAYLQKKLTKFLMYFSASQPLTSIHGFNPHCITWWSAGSAHTTRN